MSNTAGNFNLRARGAACTLVSQVASSGRSGHDMVVTWGWRGFNSQGAHRLIYWGFDCTGECGMDRYYASFRELESNFRPARVFHSAFAVTSYYAYLKQRTKTLFQILFSLGHCSHSVHSIINAGIQRQTERAHFHSEHASSQTTAHSLRFIYWVAFSAGYIITQGQGKEKLQQQKKKNIHTDWFRT